MGFRVNEFTYDGNVKFNLQLRQSRAGKSYLYATFEGDSSSINVTFFGALAEALAAQATQGASVVVRGYQSSRKGSDGYYNNQAIAREFSLNGGRSFVTEQTLNAPQQRAGVQQVQQVLQQPAEQRPQPDLSQPRHQQPVRQQPAQPAPQQQPGFDDFSDEIPF